MKDTMRAVATTAGRGRRATRRRWRVQPLVARLRGADWEPVLLVALAGLALLTRWPRLLTEPHFTDEISEAHFALQIARGEIFPLVDQTPYFGPVHAYLVAGLLWLFGPSVALPRYVMLACGVLTVLAVYLLGRELAGRGVGALAALLLITSPQHILINSHVGWLASSMPLYSTLCLWAVARALRNLRAVPPPLTWRGVGGPLCLAGLLFGLALQTHPGAIVLAVPLLLTVALALRAKRSWALLRTPWPYLGVLAALLAYSPVVIGNLTTRLDGLNTVVNDREYAFEDNPTGATYLAHLRDLGFQLLRMISDPTRLPARPLDYLLAPHLLGPALLCVAGLVILARRGEPLALLATLTVLLVIPRFLRAYGLTSDYLMETGRYLGYLLPLLLIASATALTTLLRVASTHLPPLLARWSPRATLSRTLVRAAWAVLCALVVLYPLVPLQRYYRDLARVDPNNPSFFALLATLEAERGARTPVLVDSFLEKVHWKEGVDASEVVAYMLEFEDIPYREIDDPRATLAALAGSVNPADREALPLIITMRDRCWPLRDQFPLRRVSDRLHLRDFYPGLPSYFAIYRYDPTAKGSGCYGPGGPQAGD